MSVTKRTRTARISTYKKESKGKSKLYKRGLAKGLRVGSEGKERRYLDKVIDRYSN